METIGTMRGERRDCRVYFVPCPDNPDHFILLNPADPTWEKTPPTSPITTQCWACGPMHSVSVTEQWRLGYASSDERDEGYALAIPELIPLKSVRR
jgi:hypothetical protein